MQVKDLEVGDWFVALPHEDIPTQHWGRGFKILEKIQNDRINVVDTGRMVYTVNGITSCTKLPGDGK